MIFPNIKSAIRGLLHPTAPLWLAFDNDATRGLEREIEGYLDTATRMAHSGNGLVDIFRTAAYDPERAPTLQAFAELFASSTLPTPAGSAIQQQERFQAAEFTYSPLSASTVQLYAAQLAQECQQEMEAARIDASHFLPHLAKKILGEFHTLVLTVNNVLEKGAIPYSQFSEQMLHRHEICALAVKVCDAMEELWRGEAPMKDMEEWRECAGNMLQAMDSAHFRRPILTSDRQDISHMLPEMHSALKGLAPYIPTLAAAAAFIAETPVSWSSRFYHTQSSSRSEEDTLRLLDLHARAYLATRAVHFLQEAGLSLFDALEELPERLYDDYMNAENTIIAILKTSIATISTGIYNRNLETANEILTFCEAYHRVVDNPPEHASHDDRLRVMEGVRTLNASLEAMRSCGENLAQYTEAAQFEAVLHSARGALQDMQRRVCPNGWALAQLFGLESHDAYLPPSFLPPTVKQGAQPGK